MWTIEHVICEDCLSEVSLYTDGRFAYAITNWVSNPRDFVGETTDISRDGLTLTAACPTIRLGQDECKAVLRWVGEGTSIDDKVAAAMYTVSEPIAS